MVNELGNIEVIPISSPVLELNVSPVAIKGDSGLSAYQVAVENGFVGTVQEWLDSLKTDTLNWNSTNW